MKEIFFVEWCPKCKHASLDEGQDPCFDCLRVPARDNSHKPVMFEEKEQKKVEK